MYNLLYVNGKYKETVLRNQPIAICKYERKLRIANHNYNPNNFKIERNEQKGISTSTH